MSRPQVGWWATISGAARPRRAQQGAAQDQLLHVAARQARVRRCPARRRARRSARQAAHGRARAARCMPAARRRPALRSARAPRSPTAAGRPPRPPHGGLRGCAPRRRDQLRAARRQRRPASDVHLPASSARAAQQSASATWPLPDTPATATISPARSARSTPAQPAARRAGRALCAAQFAHPPRPRPRAGRHARGATRHGPPSTAASCACWRRRRQLATSLPAAQHGDAVRHAQHLVQLVADEDDGQALRHHLPSVANSASLSCGVSTAVGSSRIRMRAPRYSAFRISTRWRSPTDRRRRAHRVDLQAEALRHLVQPARARRARRENGCHSGSVPSITLSSTLRLSASVKCWCTMPMPAASAARGWPGGSGWPNDLDLPASAT
jgi:hypothetical protein